MHPFNQLFTKSKGLGTAENWPEPVFGQNWINSISFKLVFQYFDENYLELSFFQLIPTLTEPPPVNNLLENFEDFSKQNNFALVNISVTMKYPNIIH